jgi:CDGSH-type Zn-finger protein
METTKITSFKNGHYKEKGPLTLVLPDGTEETKEEAFLCRCGASSNKPFCDGSHAKIGFNG